MELEVCMVPFLWWEEVSQRFLCFLYSLLLRLKTGSTDTLQVQASLILVGWGVTPEIHIFWYWSFMWSIRSSATTWAGKDSGKERPGGRSPTATTALSTSQLMASPAFSSGPRGSWLSLKTTHSWIWRRRHLVSMQQWMLEIQTAVKTMQCKLAFYPANGTSTT